MKSYFFNAEPTTDLVNHPTGYDREYDADDHAEFFAPFFTEAGVMGQEADSCKVVAVTRNTLRICAGCAYVRGRMVKFDGTEIITVTKSCIIVARMNKSADVRAFQLLAVQELMNTQDVFDLELARVTIGDGGAEVTDTRTFMAFTGQPPYYPPESDNLPYALWLYTLGFPMTETQRKAVEGNGRLMEIFRASLPGRSQQLYNVQIATGSYIGTGTYGQSTPNSLSFDFEPDVVFVFTDNYVPVEVAYDGHGTHTAFSGSFVCFLRGGSAVKARDIYETVIPGTGNVSYSDVTAMPYTIDGNTASWYFNGRSSSIGPSSQMNTSGTVYHYLAIGRGQAE